MKGSNFKFKIYVDLQTIIIFFLIITLNVVFNCSEVGLPIMFPSKEVGIEILQTIVRSIVVLLSIIFSFTLLSFQIFNKYFGRFAFTDFFKSKHLKILFTLFILNVAFLIYSISYLKSVSDTPDLTSYGKLIFIESIFFSVALSVSIFPIMISLLSNSQSKQNLKNLFDSINNYNIQSFQSLQLNISDEQYENNPFKLINEIGLNAIKDYDNNSLEIITTSISLKSAEIFKSEKSIETKSNLYYNFTDNLKDFFSYAVKEKNSIALSKILNIRLQIEQETIKYDFLKDDGENYYGWDFNREIEFFFNKAIQNNEESICVELINIYLDHFSSIIRKKMPLSFEYNLEKRVGNLSDLSIVSTNYNLIGLFSKNAGLGKKASILQGIANLYKTLDIIIIESKNSPDAKKYLLFYNNFYKELYLENLIVDAQIKNIESQNLPFGIANGMEQTSLSSAIILRTELKIVDYFFNKEVLNNIVLNDLKAAAFHIISNFHDNVIYGKDLLKEIIDKFDHIRGLIDESSSLEKKELYISLKLMLQHIKSKYEDENIDYLLKDHFEEIIGKFKNAEKFEKDLKEKGFVSNINLF